MDKWKEKKIEVLSKYFGYRTFRDGQDEVIDSILAGRDTLAVMPTGAGKSLCYQVPALLMEGITLVISPLLSLMKDQVRALNDAGVHAAYLNSSLTWQQYTKALELARNYRYKIIYVAPERLTSEEFLEFAMGMNISMISVDEAHCISQWGQNFRPSYLKVIEFVDRLPKRPILSAFTATATWQVREDIVDIMKLRDPQVTLTGFDRKNLYFEVRKPKDKYIDAVNIVEKYKKESGIIYCLTRKIVEEVCERLTSEGYSVTRYHAGLSDGERMRNQDDFIYDRKNIMVATNAFGMGIDKPNIHYVIHYNMPKDLESYYQEAGRAGRDGEPAVCVLLYGGKDVITNQFFIDNNDDNQELDPQMRKFVMEKDRERLRKMTFYCFTNDCLREYILKYFNEYNGHFCGNCSNCLTNFEEVDVTEIAECLIGCVKTSGQRYGINAILDTLRGSKAVRVRRYRLDENPYYGKLAGKKDPFLRQVLNHLLLQEQLFLTEEEYPVLRLTSGSAEVLSGETTVIMKMVKDIPQEPKEKKKKGRIKYTAEERELTEAEELLFERLRELRREIAAKGKVPPYIVFNDKTLREMARQKPKTEAEMLEISGVGAAKFEKYGEQFIKEIMQEET